MLVIFDGVLLRLATKVVRASSQEESLLLVYMRELHYR